MTYLEEIRRKREEAQLKLEQEKSRDKLIKATKSGSATVAAEVARQNARNRITTQSVSVTNQDLAKSQDIDKVIRELKETQLAALLGGQNKSSVILADSTDLGDVVAELGNKITNAIETIKSDKSQAEAIKSLVNEYKTVVKAFESMASKHEKAIKDAVAEFNASLDKKDFTPTINVPETKLDIPPVDVQPFTAAIKSLETAIKANKVTIPPTDFSSLNKDVRAITSAINSLSFPVPNYVLPFKSYDGKATQLTIPKVDDRIFERVSNTNGNSTAFTNFSASADKKNYVRGYSITNTSSTNGYVDFRDGTGGSVLWTVPIPANGGANVMLDEPIFWTSANTALAYDVSAALTTVYISVTGFQS